jgi:putative hydrolase of the HAD superfamily
MSEKKLIAFDMYGTRVNSWPMISPYKTLFSQLAINKETARHLAHTLMTTSENIENILPKTGKTSKEIDVALENFYENISTHLSQLSIFPDFPSTIAILKSIWYRTAVISNLSKFYDYPLSSMVDPQTFDHQILSFDVWVVKPEKKIFDYALDKAGVKAHETIMVGDSFHSDVQWALAAGIEAVYLDRSSNAIAYKQWYVQISTLSDLFSLLQ